MDSKKLLQEIEELKSIVIQLACEWAETHKRGQLNKADLNSELVRVEYQLAKKDLEALYFLCSLLKGIQAI